VCILTIDKDPAPDKRDIRVSSGLNTYCTFNMTEVPVAHRFNTEKQFHKCLHTHRVPVLVTGDF